MDSSPVGVETSGVTVTRGAAADAWHAVSVAVVNSSGSLIAAAGQPNLVTFSRSCLKPFQALPLVRSGAARDFGLTPQELAIACASHDGTDEHVTWVRRVLAKAELGAEALQCGAHWPLGMQAARTWPLQGEERDPLRHNCSGKHAAFLLLARYLAAPTENYLSPDNPVQVLVRQAVAEVCAVPELQLVQGTDGCSAPNYAMPLTALARAGAHWAQPEPGKWSAALGPLRDAMLAHSVLVAGHQTLDHELMHAFGGELVCKSGAEGLLLLGLRRRGLGVVIKVHDGNPRVLAPAALSVLQQLGELGAEQRQALQHHLRPQIHNAAGLLTGEIVSRVQLAF